MKLTKKAISLLGFQAATLEAVPRATLRAEGERLARESGVTEYVSDYGHVYADGFEKRQRELQKEADQVARETARLAQLDAMMTGEGSAQSLKAAETFRRMETVPADWKRVGIRWTIETVTGVVPVDCPGCRGDGVRTRGSYVRVACGHEGCTAGNRVLTTRRAMSADVMVSGVETTRRTVFTVRETRTFQVEVGRPDFAPGYQWASRFTGGGNCHLCNKSIRSGEFCFVEAQKHGKVLAMAVGCDCARTFLGVKKVEPLEIGQRLEVA